MRTFFRRAASLLAVALLSSPAVAQNTVSVYVDADASAATGCTVMLPGGTFTGADTRISVSVTPGATPSVGTPTQSSCAGGAFSGGAAIGTSALGLNTGAGGADVIEIGVPEGAVHGPLTLVAPVGFTATNAQGSDVLFPTGAAIVFGGATPTAVPTLTWLGGALLLVAVLLLARRAIRRSRLLLLSLFAVAGLAWAAGFVVDGQVGDWAGETLYADPLGDPTNGQASIDIATGGAEAEGSQAFFRIDIRDLQNQPPVANAQTVAATEDTPVTITLSGSDAEGSPLTFAISSAATRGTLSAITQLTPTTASVTYTPNANTNGADSFSFTVNDGQINSLPATVTINVAAVNDAPVVTPATFSVVEDSAVGTDVGTATATDADTGQTFTWAITAGNTGNAFSINPATGLIEVLTPGAIPTPGATFSLTVQATDNGTPTPLSGTGTITINVTGINDAPSFTVGPNQTVAEDAGPQTVDPWATAISPGPADEAGQTITFEVTANDNTALFSAGPAVSPTGVLTYTTAANATGTATITLRVRDNGGTAGGGVDVSPTQTFTITVTPVNDAPVVAPSGAAANFMEGSSPVIADPNIAVSDVDSPSLTGATVAITANFQSGADVLAFTPAGTITGSYNATTGVLTLSGAGTLAEYQAVLRSVTFSNSSATPTTTARTLTWTATDGTATSAPATSQVTINNVDTPPVAVDDTATVAEDSGATAIPVLANDTDSDAGPIQIASVTQPANGTVGITPSAPGTGLTYTPNANYCNAPPGTTPDTFTYTLTPGTSTATVSVTVTCVNDAPVLTPSGVAANYDEGAAPVLADPGMVVTDADHTSLMGATITITNFVAGEDTLAFTPLGAITGSFAAGTLTLTGSGTLAEYQTALRSVTYGNASSNPTTTARTLSWIATDGVTPSAPAGTTVTINSVNSTPVANAASVTTDEDTPLTVTLSGTDAEGSALTFAISTPPASGSLGAITPLTATTASVLYTPNPDFSGSDSFQFTASDGTATSPAAVVSITINPVNDAPVVTTTAGSTTFTEAGGAVVVDAGVTVTDVDTATLTGGATVSIAAGFQAGQDTLAFTPLGAITGAFAGNTLTLSGNGTPAEYQAALRSVTFDNGSTAPSTTPRTINFVVNDGAAASNTASKTVDVTAVNSPPIVDASGSLAYTEGAGAVLLAPAATIADPDSANITGATITFTLAYQTGEDVLAFTNTASITGVFNAVSGQLTLSGTDTIANYQAALRSITYTNTSDTPDTTAAIVAFIVTDDTATSSVPSNRGIDITAANDPPVNTVPGAQQVAAGATIAITGFSIADADAGAGTIRTTLSVPQGTLSVTASGTTVTGNGTGSVQIDGTLANVNATIASVSYTAPAATTAAVTLTMLTDDLGSTGGAAQTDSDTVTINVDEAPRVTATVPAAGATDVVPSDNLTVTFSETVNFTGSDFTLTCGTPRTFVVTGTTTNTATINPDADLPGGTSCTFVVLGAAISDVDTVDPTGAQFVGTDTTVDFTTRAEAFDDAYAATPNLTLGIAAGVQGGVVLANDNLGTAVITAFGSNNPAGTCAGTAPGGTSATALGGSATLNLDGSFTYIPAAGARNTADSFCYTITGGDTATVTLNLENEPAIWFVQDGAAAGGNGTQARPFEEFGGAAGTFEGSASDVAGDTIFLRTGAYLGGVAPLANQRVVGDGSSSDIGTIAGVTPVAGSSLPAFSGTDPTLTTGSLTDNLQVSAGGIVIRGLTIGDSGTATGDSSDVQGNAFGTLTITETTLNGTGRALNLTNGALTATLDDLDVTASTAQGLTLATVSGSLTTAGGTTITSNTQGILVTGSTGTFNFGNTTITAGTDAVSLQNNSAGARVFGVLNATATNGVGIRLINETSFDSTSGAIVATGTASVGSGAAIFATGSTFADATLTTLTSTNAEATAHGVNLDTNGGTLTVTGDTIVNTPQLNAQGFRVNGGTANLAFANVTINGRRGPGFNFNNGGTTSTFGIVDVDNTNSSATTGVAIDNVGSGETVTLAQAIVNNNGVSATGIAVSAPAGTVSVNGGSVTNTAGTDVQVSGAGAGAVTIAASVTNAAGRSVEVLNRDGGSVTFSATITDSAGSTGISLANNTGSTIGFTGGVVMTTNANPAFTATGGGTVFVTDPAGAPDNSITTTTGTALTVTGTAIGPSGMSFRSISSNGATRGILLDGAGTGGLTVRGDGTLARNGSGGTITNSADDAVELNNTSNVTLQSMNLTSNGNAAPDATTATTVAGDHSVQVTGGGGISLRGVLVSNPRGGILALDVGGTNRIDNNTRFEATGAGGGHGMFMVNSSVSGASFLIDDVEMVNNASAFSNIFAAYTGSGTMLLDVRNSLFEDLGVQAITASGGNGAAVTGTLTSNIVGNTFQNAKGVGENNVGMLSTLGRHIALVESNIFDNIAEDGSIANASVVRTQNSGGQLTATIRLNTIRNIAYATGGRHMIGHVFEPVAFNAADRSDLTIDNNTIQNITVTGNNREAVFIDYRANASGGNVRIRNNNSSMTSSGAQQALELRFRQTNASTVNVLVSGNTMTHDTASAFLDVDSEAAATVNATVSSNNFSNTNATPGSTIALATEAAGSVACANVSGNTLNASPSIDLNEAAGALNVTQASAAALAGANGGAAVNVAGTPQFGVAPCTLPP